MKINKVDLCLESGCLRTEIFFEGKPDEQFDFAYYIYLNGVRIHVEWYGKNKVFEFDTKGVDGYYHVMGFVKNSKGEIFQKNSTPILINPKLLTSGRVKGKDLARAMVFMGRGWETPLLYYPSPENRLFILTPSASDRSVYSLPVFNRFTWAARGLFPGKVLCISDPTLTLHDELRLGWCLGSKLMDFSDEIAGFIIDFARSAGVQNRSIVTWGSSAGGFSALAIAARIENATAVAINPQIDALKYEITRQVELIKSVVFEGYEEEVIMRDYLERVNMLELRKRRRFRSILVQNILDVHHFEVHAKYYWEGLGGKVKEGWSENSHGDFAFFYKDLRGHIAESEDMLPDIFAKCF